MKYIKLFESFVEESSFYQVQQWDDAGQKYASHFGDLDSAGISTQYKIGDVIKVKSIGSKWDEEKRQYIQIDIEKFAQVLTVFKNEETGVLLYGIRILNEDGMSSLAKIGETAIVGIVTDIPEFILNHPKYEKHS